MIRPVAIAFAAIGMIVATAGPGAPVSLNVSVGSSVDRTFYVDDDTDEIFTMRNQGKSALAACCFYVNRKGHCANDPRQVCFGKNNCGARVPCIPECSWKDFRFEIPVKSKQFPGANVVQWSAKEGVAALIIPPVEEIPFFGDLICDMVDVEDECPLVDPCL